MLSEQSEEESELSVLSERLQHEEVGFLADFFEARTLQLISSTFRPCNPCSIDFDLLQS